jgi:large subunit ribosomal protein L21
VVTGAAGRGKEGKMYAVIKTGGKQYRVAANDKITIEKLAGEPGDQIHFTDVLMVANGDAVDVGAPLVQGATVVGEIAAQEKAATVYIFKKRRRKHYRRRNGHRQLLTSVTITEILTGGAKPSGKTKSAATKSKTSANDAMASGAGTGASAVAALDTDAATMAAASSEKPAKAKKSKAQDKADDLSLIGGVGPKINEILIDLGYTSFADIAAWTDADIEKVEDRVGPKGRVARDEWIEQAKELMAGKPPRAKTDRERT